jgi:hypothetical protein
MKLGWGDNVASLALNGFDKDGRHFLRRDTPFKEVFTNPIDTGSAATRILAVMIRTTVAISIRDMGYPGD